jgi:two-component system KDP operon response regulator KdpE
MLTNKLAILIIEDEPGIVRMLEPVLEASGATTKVAWSGTQGLEYLTSSSFDLILCDLGLPDQDGKDLIAQIRAITDIPLIVLSARELEDERVRALDAGADDFVAKPFSAAELLARIRAAVRRSNANTSNGAIQLGPLTVDTERRRAVLDQVEIRLSGREHALLLLLAEDAGRVVTHQQIIERVWGAESKAETQSVRVLVGQLRQKLEENPSDPTLICTEAGVGYRLGVPFTSGT